MSLDTRPETMRDAAFRKSCEAGAPKFSSFNDRRAPSGGKAPTPSSSLSGESRNPGKRKTSRYAKDLRLWSKAIHALGDDVCERCGREGSDANPLEAHHLLERAKVRFRPYRLDLRNGCLVCRSCHQTGPEAAHRDLVAFRRWYAGESPEFAALLKEAAPEEYAALSPCSDVPAEGR